MQLSNRFNDEDKGRVWCFNNWCANCESNQGVAGHHIYGSKGKYNNSIANCIFLCNICHAEADGQNLHQTGNPLQIKYLGLALQQIVKAGYKFTENDELFLESIEKDVQEVLHS